MSVQRETNTEVVPPNAAPSLKSGEDGRTRRTIVNWVLALLTVPAAALIMIFAVGAVMSVAACSTGQCPHTGPNGVVYGILLYGAPVVAGVTVIASFLTAYRRRGFVVPLVGLTLLLADFAAIAVVF